MAEQIDSSADVPDDDATSLAPTTRAQRTAATRPAASRPARAPKAKRPARVRPAKAPKPARPVNAKSAAKPVRSLAIFAIVGGLIVTVALPAYGAWRPSAEAMTLQEVAQDGAQSLVVASAADTPDLERETYSATTPEEIEKKKAEEAAAARARQVAASVAANNQAVVASVDMNMVAPGSGEVRWPVTGFSYTEINTFRPAMRPGHNGFDMLAPAGTPIFAAAAGVVRVSQESYGGYGVAVTIDHVIGGQSVSTLYGHMTYGSRQVSPGQTVEAGQVIGLVGSTGSSSANHLHFEVTVGGGLVNPLPWLQANAG